MGTRDVLITGIGMVSSLGEGHEAHWSALSKAGAKPVVDSETFRPYSVHPLGEIDWNLQIPKRGDQRQMETWQRLGTYTAGLALDDAGLKGDEELCGAMHMIVAAGGGERDVDVDGSILEAGEKSGDRAVLLNEKLSNELRPTLFLAQLANLLAGNISIVHKVTGSSQTFMGEEGAGVAAVETASARIRSGQSDCVLVGGAYHTSHWDKLLEYNVGRFLHKGDWKPVWQRGGSDGGGIVTGSGSAFLVLESREHAERRGRTPYAALGAVKSGRTPDRGAALKQSLMRIFGELVPEAEPTLVISGASGAKAATEAEREALVQSGELVLRSASTMAGHMKEAQFPFAVALSALAIANGQAYPAFDKETESAFEGRPRAVMATSVGYQLFEGAGLVTEA